MAVATSARAITASVGRKGRNARADVKVVQELLNRNIGVLVPLRPLVVDGRVGPHTEETIMAYQRRAVGLRRPDGRVDPGGATIRKLNTAANVRLSNPATRRGLIASGESILKGVNQQLQERVLSFATKYGPVKIASGKRTVRKQAELMAPMSTRDLNMYGENTYYIKQIKALRKPRSVDAVYEILLDARKKGSRISYHLVGRAVDISARDKFDWAKASRVAKEVGLKVKKEKWRNCFHVQL